MNEKFLIAVDDSAAAAKAVAYAGRLLAPYRAGDYTITLFHVVESIPAAMLTKQQDPALASVIQTALRDWSSKAEGWCRQLLEGHKQTLVAAGVPAERVLTKFKMEEGRPDTRRVLAALAVLQEVKDGGYTTVIVGRRGSSDMPELFIGGVADKVTRHVAGVTVWIVD
jgi:nucleotide-binding universal stress UspA family protein